MFVSSFERFFFFRPLFFLFFFCRLPFPLAYLFWMNHLRGTKTWHVCRKVVLGRLLPMEIILCLSGNRKFTWCSTAVISDSWMSTLLSDLGQRRFITPFPSAASQPAVAATPATASFQTFVFAWCFLFVLFCFAFVVLFFLPLHSTFFCRSFKSPVFAISVQRVCGVFLKRSVWLVFWSCWREYLPFPALWELPLQPRLRVPDSSNEKGKCVWICQGTNLVLYGRSSNNNGTRAQCRVGNTFFPQRAFDFFFVSPPEHFVANAKKNSRRSIYVHLFFPSVVRTSEIQPVRFGRQRTG